MNKKDISPLVRIFAERLAYNEISLTDAPVSEEDITNSLSLVHSALQPNVVVIEDNQGYWSFVTGEPFMRAILHFVMNKQTYKGLYFCEHPRTVQRKILEHAINVALYDISYAESDEFKAAIKALRRLNSPTTGTF